MNMLYKSKIPSTVSFVLNVEIISSTFSIDKNKQPLHFDEMIAEINIKFTQLKPITVKIFKFIINLEEKHTEIILI